jgi:Ala-tRNA(Pro) deacylase
VFDEPLWAAEALLFHPLVNTSTLVIPHAGIERFLRATNHSWRVIDIPTRTDGGQRVPGSAGQ